MLITCSYPGVPMQGCNCDPFTTECVPLGLGVSLWAALICCVCARWGYQGCWHVEGLMWTSPMGIGEGGGVAPSPPAGCPSVAVPAQHRRQCVAAFPQSRFSGGTAGAAAGLQYGSRSRVGKGCYPQLSRKVGQPVRFQLAEVRCMMLCCKRTSVSAPVCGALHAVVVFCSLATALWLLPTQTQLLYF